MVTVKTQRQVGATPRLIERPAQKMAVVRTFGDPNIAGQTAISALYGAVFTLKFARKRAGSGPDFKVEPLRARWPDFATAPKAEWRGVWALPVPDDTTPLPQKDPATPVTLETWEYGTVAEIVHNGPYTTEAPTIERLRAFIAAAGYTIAGDHEEEYLTRPTAKRQRTIIRYPVRRA